MKRDIDNREKALQWKYEGSPASSENFVNFGPQTGETKTRVFAHPPQILRSASLTVVVQGKRNTTKTRQTGGGK